MNGFDVSEPDHWEAVGPVDVACLNAGVLGGPPDPAELTVDGYRRAVAVNLDGVVLGVRRLATVMPAGGRIVCTASLAGLTAAPDDPVYAATKHAVVGFVRSAASALAARGLSINAVCPGFADTPMVAGAARDRLTEARISAPRRRPTSPRPPGSRSSRARRATRGSSSRGARRSTSVSRPCPARAAHPTSRSAVRRHFRPSVGTVSDVGRPTRTPSPPRRGTT